MKRTDVSSGKKVCTKCGVIKRLADFYPRYIVGGNVGTSHCRDCIRAKKRETDAIKRNAAQ